MAGTVKVNFTIGAGNNIFQYMYSRLLAHVHNAELSNPSLPCLNIEANHVNMNKSFGVVKIGRKENDFHKYLDSSLPSSNYFVDTYAEDYTVYKPHMGLIRSWVNTPAIVNKEDLVLHLRLGDRLLRKSDYNDGMLTTVGDYVNAIKMFEYDRLHIVTDMKEWKYVTPQDICEMHFHVDVPVCDRLVPSESAKYFNSLVKGLSELKPIVRAGNSVEDDFAYMTSFDKFLFKHGTLAWWAAALSGASQVGVYGQWRPNKGSSNKNLGNTDFDGWFKWGNK